MTASLSMCAGWKVLKNAEGVDFLRQEWKVKDFPSAVEMFDRIGMVAEEAGHHPDLHLKNCNEIAAELSSHSLGWSPATASGTLRGGSWSLACRGAQRRSL